MGLPMWPTFSSDLPFPLLDTKKKCHLSADAQKSLAGNATWQDTSVCCGGSGDHLRTTGFGSFTHHVLKCCALILIDRFVGSASATCNLNTYEPNCSQFWLHIQLTPCGSCISLRSVVAYTCNLPRLWLFGCTLL